MKKEQKEDLVFVIIIGILIAILMQLNAIQNNAEAEKRFNTKLNLCKELSMDNIRECMQGKD